MSAAGLPSRRVAPTVSRGCERGDANAGAPADSGDKGVRKVNKEEGRVTDRRVQHEGAKWRVENDGEGSEGREGWQAGPSPSGSRGFRLLTSG